MAEKKEKDDAPEAATVRMRHEAGAGVGSFTLSIGKVQITVTDGECEVPADLVEAATGAGFRAA